MSTNSETFPLESGLNWKRATLERCNIVLTNNLEQSYIIDIDGMHNHILLCESGAIKTRNGTFTIGREPWNPEESNMVYNTTDKNLDQLKITVYNAVGALATISNDFQLKLRIDM